MPAAHRSPKPDHPADASSPTDTPGDAPAASGHDTDATASTDPPLEWADPDDRASDGLTEPGLLLEAELECARLRARVLELEAELEDRDRERQKVIDRYEHLLAERDRPTPVRRQSFGEALLDRLRHALPAST